MRRVDTQLVRASGHRLKADNSAVASITLYIADNLVTCHRRFSGNIIHLLPRAVLVIGSKRQFNYSLAPLRNTFKHGLILFCDLARCELTLQILIYLH